MLHSRTLRADTKRAILLPIKKCFSLTFYFVVFVLSFFSNSVLAQTTSTLSPSDDAFVRGGTYASTNFGADLALEVKSGSSSLTRISFLKFNVSSVSSVATATLRIYGYNTSNSSALNISAYQVSNDGWSEGTIINSNAPPASTLISSVAVNNVAKYYDFDVTNFVQSQFNGDKIVSFLIKDPSSQNVLWTFNSKENAQNKPQLVITTNASGSPSNAMLFVENPDKFPLNGHFVFSKIQTPWAGGEPWAHGDGVTFNSNRDSVRIRVRNNGLSPLIISNFKLANTTTWHIEKLNKAPYNPGSTFPLNIASGGAADLILRFVGINSTSRITIFRDTLTIVSNDDKFPSKQVFLDGVWQRLGEGSREPHAQEIITTFDFKTKTGFVNTDPDFGDSTKLKGDEIKPSYFVRANPSYPVVITQMASYHSCCISPEKLQWYTKGASTLTTLFTHLGTDAQRLQPRRVSSDSSLAAAAINPAAPFGFKIGSLDWMDAAKNPGGKIGIRVWKAIDTKGNIIPNCYIFSNDYLGTSGTNYDYNDNMHFITNVKPEKGASFASILTSTPSALDFGEKNLQTTDSLTVSIKNSGQTYADGSSDPAINISSVQITGENSSEFSFTMPASTLTPQQASNIKVKFKPTSQGLKIADLLVFYNSSVSPLRIPLYGIGKASTTTVTVNYRIKCGSSTAVTVNGKTWSADTYAVDNLEPFSNPSLTQVACTDEDALYLREQSSNANKKPFRYVIPITTNGDYAVRLHFAEGVWGAPGGGYAGGAGSRVMSIKIEGQYRLINFDVAQEVGPATAVIKNFPVTVTDNNLNIDFSATVDRPMVNAIEVYSFSGSPAPPMTKVTDSSSITSNASAINLISENNFEKPRIYPNPLTNRFAIQFPGKYEGKYDLQIIDLMGRKYEIGKTILKQGGSNLDIDISRFTLSPGVYSLRIHSDAGKADVIKLIVQ